MKAVKKKPQHSWKVRTVFGDLAVLNYGDAELAVITGEDPDDHSLVTDDFVLTPDQAARIAEILNETRWVES